MESVYSTALANWADNHMVSTNYSYFIFINCLHTAIWFHAFLLNTNNFHTILQKIWIYQTSAQVRFDTSSFYSRGWGENQPIMIHVWLSQKLLGHLKCQAINSADLSRYCQAPQRPGHQIKITYLAQTPGEPWNARHNSMILTTYQMVYTQSYGIKYFNLIQIICTQLYGIKYSYQIAIICTLL